jgi:predicted nucleotidyltransferase
MPFSPAFPTAEHRRAAEAFTSLYRGRSGIEAILLVNSCARGKASPDSCLDLAILLNPRTPISQRAAYQAEWESNLQHKPVFDELKKIGVYANTEPYFMYGQFNPGNHDWTSGPDEFELEIGNCLAYSFPLWQGSSYLAQLKAQWLPFYNDQNRNERLDAVRGFCLNNLNHIPLYAKRGLYFQCLARLQNAFKEFLQALFIAHRTYPISYDKWIQEQVVQILGLPQLYALLPGLFEFQHFESLEIVSKAGILRNLLEEYTSI